MFLYITAFQRRMMDAQLFAAMCDPHVGSSTYRLSIPVAWRIHNVFHVSLLSRTRDDTIPGRISPVQPVVQIQEQELWVIERFVNVPAQGPLGGSD